MGVDRLQRYNHRLLRNALRETRLLTALNVSADRRIRIANATWDEYWGQCDPLAKEIAELKAAWTTLIVRNFVNSMRHGFVRAYFRLLRACLDRHARGENVLSLLRKVVGFETIRVSGDCGGSAAAIVSARHPVYLLSKLATPHAPENPKYLPLVCPCGIAPETDSLYWHYRRIPLIQSDGIQLFVYPCVTERSLSHRTTGDNGKPSCDRGRGPAAVSPRTALQAIRFGRSVGRRFDRPSKAARGCRLSHRKKTIRRQRRASRGIVRSDATSAPIDNSQRPSRYLRQGAWYQPLAIAVTRITV